MPQIIVTADRMDEQGERAVMLCERVTPADFQSGHFQSQLVERLGWAVNDAREVEQEREEDESRDAVHETARASAIGGR